jgi:ATP-binding cassette subfamily B protein
VGTAIVAGVLVAVALVVALVFGHFSHMDHFEVSEAGQSRLRGELMELVNGPPYIGHLDQPDFADNVSLVRDGLWATGLALEAVLQLAGLLLQMAITVVLLVLVSPWFVFLPLCAVVPVLLERVAQNTVEGTRERAAGRLRLSRHLLEVATATGPVRELRLFGAEEEILARQERAWSEVTTSMWHGQLRAATCRALGQGFFALGYGAAIVLELYSALHGHGSVGDLVIVITLAVQVSTQVSGALGILSLLQVAGRTTDRIGELRAAASAAALPSAAPPSTVPPSTVLPTAARPAAASDRPDPEDAPSRADGGTAAVPDRLDRGITLDNVSFAYPGANRPVLSGVNLHIPAGSVLALVGENGAGKSTLVKLLCGLYQPTGGRILVDGTDMAALGPAQWRARVATLFQDFHRIELTLGESIGHGDIARVDDEAAIRAAAAKARADRILATVPGGLAGYIGQAYDDGVDLSGGQWQTVGLARALMRPHPLLLILDEPAAALDASAEHDLFERYATSAGQAGTEHGGITVLISHRFSTVGMADTIAVLKDGLLAENGTHRELMAHGGLYAELFTLQARAYS